MMIKILQAAVVAVFLAFAIIGVVILFACPDSLDEFQALVNTLFPIFLAQVIPALIGSPLTDYIRAHAEKVRGNHGL